MSLGGRSLNEAVQFVINALPLGVFFGRSESSMFVAPYRLILKTCGRTSLLPAVPCILELARKHGLTKVQEMFFSRRNFGRPEQQSFPHQAFDDEASFLNGLFGRCWILTM